MKYALLFGSVLFSAFAQVMMKIGVDHARSGAAESATWLGGSLAALLDWRVLLGLAAYGAAAVFWLGALARFPLSFAYPFVALGFVLTLFASAAILGEPVNATRVAGTLVIAFGAYLVGQS